MKLKNRNIKQVIQAVVRGRYPVRESMQYLSSTADCGGPRLASSWDNCSISNMLSVQSYVSAVSDSSTAELRSELSPSVAMLPS